MQPCLHDDVNLGDDWVGQLVLQSPLFSVVIVIGVEAVHVGCAQSEQSLFRLYPFMCWRYNQVQSKDFLFCGYF